jgi:uncharacterized protein (TIGR02996 family)
MTHADAFLQAVVADPEDDAPRLVFADWLEDHGDAVRAEFIRAQCELTKLPAGDPRRWELQDRERALLAEHGDAWAAPLEGLVRRWQFRRGFVEAVSLPAAALLSHGDELFRLAPVRHAHLPAPGVLYGLLRQSPELATRHLRRLTGLDLSAGYVLPLQDLPRLPQLTSLNAGHLNVTTTGARLLAGAPLLASLTSLGFRSRAGDFGPAGVLLQAPHLQRLTTLRLTACRIGDDGVEALLRLPVVSRLTALYLGHNRITPAGVQALASSRAVAGLTTLDLSFNDIRPAGVRTLAGSPHLGQLAELNLSRCGLGDDGAAALAGSALLGRLLALDLSLNHVSDRGGRALAAYPRPARLASLDLIYNRLSPPTMQALRQRFGERVCFFSR